MCVIDTSDGVLRQVEQLMMPSMCLWAMSINKFDELFLMSIVNKIDHHLLASNKQKYMNTRKVNIFRILKITQPKFFYVSENIATTY